MSFVGILNTMNLNQTNKISLTELRAKAEAGDVEAQSALGLFYELGIEVPTVDTKEAAKWWGKAAKSGSTAAQFSLAELITHEFADTEENRVVAQALYKKAESNGFVRADKAMRLLNRESGHSWTILVVDDSAKVRLEMKTILEAEGCDVIEAADGKEALLQLQRHAAIRTVFTDLTMPIMDGFEFIKAVRGSEKWSHLPIVVVTAENSEKTVTMGRQLKVNGWIVKPMKPQLVLRYLSKLAQHAKITRIKSAS